MAEWTDRLDFSNARTFWAAPIAERAAAFAALRERAPVTFFAETPHGPLPPGPGFWALTRMDDVVEASRTPAVFTSGSGTTTVADMPAEIREFFGSMINVDGPRHARMRRIVSRGFTPRRIAMLVDDIADTARRIVDDALELGECDAVSTISSRLPTAIICDLMGIPASQYGVVLAATRVISGMSDPEYVPETGNAVTALHAAGTSLAELMRELGRDRERHPADDVTSLLVSAEIDGERLTSDELASFFVLLVVAGSETTRNAISWGLHLLTEHPDQRRRWLDDVDRVTPSAVEEILRWSSPTIFMRRTLAVDTVLGGQAMAAGDKVAMFYWAANRDPAHFADPDAFDVRRSPNPHIAFGGPGPHFCLGAHLARLEIATMFRELLTRAPDVHTTAPPRRLLSMLHNGIKSLPVAMR